MQERYTIQSNFMGEDETPYSYTVGYMHRYGGLGQVSWRPVETFYSFDVAREVCDKLNAKRILNEYKEDNENAGQ